mmetsp:Transcript_6116/g.12256  ORF Transcript_6116/g.12256 Transcript_6116/m.12256 type:complete len:703 (+) Transcript_6116:114-2222(+)|eukprot:scaffold14974_cov195-Amphora_coffeaeformis.AAC.27
MTKALSLLLLLGCYNHHPGHAWVTPHSHPSHPLSRPSLRSSSTTTTTLFSWFSPPKKASSSTVDDTVKQDDDDAFAKALQNLIEKEDPPLVETAEDAESTIDLSLPNEQKESDAAFLARQVWTSSLSQQPQDREELLDVDPALRLVSSEVGLLELSGTPMDDAAVATSILLERTFDTAEDIMMHLRRSPLMGPMRKLANQTSVLTNVKRKTVVVLGSGWGAHALMKVSDCCKVRLIVVSPSNHFVFTPMLASAAVGSVEYRSMTESVRDANPHMEDYIEGKAIDVDVHQKKVKIQLNSLLAGVEEGDPPVVEVDYDHLIVAVGNQVHDSNVPGAKERCLRLKSCEDARRLRTAIGEAFEYASRPGLSDEERTRRVTFTVIGGGPTGVELAGELSDFCHDITQPDKGAYPKLAKHANVVLIHGGPELLPQFDEELRPEAVRTLERRGVQVILNTRVTQVSHGSVSLSTKVLDAATGQPTGQRTEREFPMGLSVWCAGIAPVPFVDTLLSKLPDQARGVGGRVNVDRWLRPPMPDPSLTGSVLVLGDAASRFSRRPLEAEKQGDATATPLLPQTAQVAGQQGAYVARLLTRGYNLTAEVPVLPCRNSDEPCEDPSLAAWLAFRNLQRAPGFSFLNLGLLAYLGGGKALSQVQIGDVPVFSYTGSVAFVLWRSVYLVKQVATRNRILVTFDWLKSALFGRDTTRL